MGERSNWCVLKEKKKLAEKKHFHSFTAPLFHTWQDFESRKSHLQPRNIIITSVHSQRKWTNTRLQEHVRSWPRIEHAGQRLLGSRKKNHTVECLTSASWPLPFGATISHMTVRPACYSSLISRQDLPRKLLVCATLPRSLRVTRRSKWIESLFTACTTKGGKKKVRSLFFASAGLSTFEARQKTCYSNFFTLHAQALNHKCHEKNKKAGCILVLRTEFICTRTPAQRTTYELSNCFRWETFA